MKKLLCCLSLMMFLSATASAAVPLPDKVLIQYKADALNYADGAYVSSWGNSGPDTTAAGSYTLKQVTGYGLPTFVANALNGLPAVKFVKQADPTAMPNSTKTLLQSDSWDWAAGTGAEAITVFMVAQGGKSNFNQRALRVGKAGGNNGQIIDIDLRSGPGNDNTVGFGARYSNGYSAAPNVLTQGTWHIVTARILKTQTYGQFLADVDGVSKTVYTATGETDWYNPQDTANVVMMGNGTNASGVLQQNEYYDGQIAEVLVYKYLANQADVDAVYNYLYSKYYNLIAHNPSPAKLSVDQGTVQKVGSNYVTQVEFNWDACHESGTSPAQNPNITEYRLYYATTEPNLAIATPITVAAGPERLSSGVLDLQPQKKYYWRVDGVWDSVGGEPNCVTGDVWTFTTRYAAPRVTSSSGSLRVFPGESATFSVTVESPYPVTYEWHRSIDNAKDGLNDYIFPDNAPTIVIPSAQVSDQGFIYCKVTNEASNPLAPITSTMRLLGIKREMAHYTLDSADYVDGGFGGKEYKDVSTADTDYYNVPQSVIDPSVFVASNWPALNQAVDFSINPLASGYSATCWTSAYTDWITVSAWVKWNGVTGAAQGIVCNQGSGVSPESNSNNWYFQLDPASSKLEFIISGGTGDVTSPQILNIGQWYHVAATVGSGGTKIYVDGELIMTGTDNAIANRNYLPIYLGAQDRNETNMIETFNGIIDDVRIYNYPLSVYEIVDLYTAQTGEHFCLNPDGLDMRFDVTDDLGGEPDCLVNIADFARFADDWLQTGLYPLSL